MREEAQAFFRELVPRLEWIEEFHEEVGVTCDPKDYLRNVFLLLMTPVHIFLNVYAWNLTDDMFPPPLSNTATGLSATTLKSRKGCIEFIVSRLQELIACNHYLQTEMAT